jgi:excisionase family DNA binding protein
MAPLLTPRDAAMRLGISYAAIKQWIYRGKLKAIKTPGGHYRIPESELDALLFKAKRPETPRRQLMRTVSGWTSRSRVCSPRFASPSEAKLSPPSSPPTLLAKCD